MLNLTGPSIDSRFCDGVSRRSFLKVGSLGVGGLTLPQLLSAEERQGTKSSKSVIMVYLSGGISHQDTFDLKMEAPDEIRGEFQPIDTKLPGVQFCELLPQLSQAADKFSVIRSVVGLSDEHSSFQNLTGYRMGVAQRDGKPTFGSVVSQLNGPLDSITPPFVDLFPTMKHQPYNSPDSGLLGPKYQAIKADGEVLESMKLRYISADQFSRRRSLLQQLDDFRREADAAESLVTMNHTYSKAFDVLTSSKLVTALDVEQEDPKVRERYGKGSPKHLGDGAPMWNDQLLQARRLVEAGVRVVTVAYGFWDTHGNNFSHLRKHLPLFDTGISALIEDIHSRGLQDDVTVLVWGEFGRTPKINDKAGRDHWARVSNALFSGGGLQPGQIIGATDKTGGEALDRPVHFHDVLSTAYHTLGISPDDRMLDTAGARLQILPPGVRPIRELI
ncbi:MAG: DUF1501 domain-containing protein [Planctomycetaceae bacterium]|nr:DUF1501 domain-containing protein [Planctomycetaceae bacterium]